jgi:Fe2+ or Zn2+ uptake regulation protein
MPHPVPPPLQGVADLLAAGGQRYTGGRRRLVEILAGATHPLTLAEIQRRCPELALSSAYRNLRVLERCGIVRRIVDADGISHAELSEAIAGHHHHAVCGRCGRMERLILPPLVEQELDALAVRVSRRGEFELSEHRVELVGICADCGSQTGRLVVRNGSRYDGEP